MNFTLKALAQRIATDDSEEAAKTASRRIEHWVSMGLFELAGVDIGPKAIGRGRVRKYPEPSLPWCLLWAALADRGLGFNAMVTTVQAIQDKLADKGQQGKWLRQAMKGEGPAVFLFDERAGLLLARVGMAEQHDRACGILAYGDIKRVELAVALANQPKLLLMDEPTAGMAPKERVELMALAAEIVRERNICVLFTEHDMDVVFAHADRIMVLDRGKLIAEGPPKEVRANSQVQEIYLGSGAVHGVKTS